MMPRKLMRERKKESLQERARKFLDRDFIDRQVVPLVPEISQAADQSDCTGEIVRAKGTGRITVRYDFSNGVSVYAKAYTDGLGASSYNAHRCLWQNGFNQERACQVPEPLGFVIDENLLLMRRAEGLPLDHLLCDKATGEMIEAARATARWLAQLHATEMPCAPAEPPCERIKIFKLADMLTKAAAAYPEQAPLLLDQIQRIRKLAPSETSSPKLAPTHGQFTPANVFIDADQVSVIDLDRLWLSDPAKDVALFVHRVRNLLYKRSCNTTDAERITSAFVEEYARYAEENLVNLRYYAALYTLKGFAKFAKDRAPEDQTRLPLERFHLDEFERHVGGNGAGPTHHATPHPPDPSSARSAKGSREELGRWAFSITESDFIGRHIYPTLSNGTSATLCADGLRCETTVVQNTGTGRLTLRYDFDKDETIYAKLYTDELGAHSHRVLKELWDGGFNREARYQVPEPLAFLPEHNLVLMRGVTGKPLAAALKGDTSIDLTEGSRQAARWLAALHRCSIRVGEPEPDWDSLKIFRVCVRLIKAAAARPEQREYMLDLLHSLKDQIKKLPDKRVVAQTHGRYHHEHVFLDGDSVAVIDLDRSRPTDPAKDVTEFVRVLRMTACKSHLDMKQADQATIAFLEEYLSQVPEAVAGLAYYWSSFILLSFFGFVKKVRVEDPRWRELMDFHQRELGRVTEMKLCFSPSHN